MKLTLLLTLLFFGFSGHSQTQNFWTKKADFSGLKRERAVAFSINGKGYVGTGVDTADVVRKDFWEYDPILNTWTQKADIIGVARRNAVGFSINDKGYVGTGMDNPQASFGNTLSDFMEYDPLSNTWMIKASFPGGSYNGVYFATGFSADNKGYICGGKRGPNNYTDQLWEYKPVTDAWIQRQNFPGGVRYQLCSFVIDNLAYVGLGIDQDVFRKDLWKYNPATNSWTAQNDFLGGERGAVCTFTLGQRGFIAAGSDGGFKNDLWEFNPFDNSWSIRANFGGSERKNAVAFTINGKAYMGTGKGLSGKKMSVYEYSPYDVLSIEKNEKNTITTYPNPIRDKFTISGLTLKKYMISIYNLHGEIVSETQSNSSQLTIERKNIEAGIYIMIVRDENHQLINTQKLSFQ